jgi:hypothetical protein
MTLRLVRSVVWLIVLMGSSGVYSAKGQSLQTLLTELQSTDASVREQAFYALRSFGYASADQVKAAVIGLLTLETGYVQDQAAAASQLTEDYVTYYGDLVGAVASLKDARSVTALLGVVDTGNMAASALAGFGRGALDPVIGALSSVQPTTRAGAVLVLSKMLEPSNFPLVNDPVSLSKIGLALEKTTLDSNHLISVRAQQGLVQFLHFSGPLDILKVILSDLLSVRATVTDDENGHKLDEAVRHLTKSVTPRLWLDQTHIQGKEGEEVFDEDKQAVNELFQFVGDEKSAISDSVIFAFIDRIARADRLLALVAIGDASGKGDARTVEQANAELSKGDSQLGQGKYGDAIERYKHAWEKAEEALQEGAM